MNVKYFDLSNEAAGPARQCQLEDLFDESAIDELETARDELMRNCRVYIGGGAAPLFLVVKS